MEHCENIVTVHHWIPIEKLIVNGLIYNSNPKIVRFMSMKLNIRRINFEQERYPMTNARKMFIKRAIKNINDPKPWIKNKTLLNKELNNWGPRLTKEQTPERLEWEELSLHSDNIDFLEQNLDKIDWDDLSFNPFAIPILEKHPDKINWIKFSANPSIFTNDEDFCCK